MTYHAIQGKLRPQTTGGIPSMSKDQAQSGSDLVKNLVSQIQKVVNTKRTEMDKLNFILNKRKEELDKSKLCLQDLTTECQALGLDKYQDESERLQPVNLVSRRCFFSKHTEFHKLEEQLLIRGKDAQAVVRKSLTYDHILKRLLKTRIDKLKENNELKFEVAEMQQKILELDRMRISSIETLGQAQSQLADLKISLEHETEEWEREERERLKYVSERSKFSQYCDKMLQKAGKIQQNSSTESTTLYGRVAAKKIFNKHSNRQMQNKIDKSSHEEAYLENAFRSIGAIHLVDTPEELVQVCRTHMQLREELDHKLNVERNQIKTLQDEILTYQGLQLNQQPKTSYEKNAERVILQKQLDEALKESKHCADEYQYIDSQVQPVKNGIEQLVKRICGRLVNMDDMNDIEGSFELVEKELLNSLAFVSHVEDSKVFVSVNKGSETIVSLIDNPSQVLSKYNIRVRPRDEQAGTVSNNARRKSISMNEEGTDEDDVIDRSQFKTLSANLVATKSKKK